MGGEICACAVPWPPRQMAAVTFVPMTVWSLFRTVSVVATMAAVMTFSLPLPPPMLPRALAWLASAHYSPSPSIACTKGYLPTRTSTATHPRPYPH
jgi:hypothetical protein